MRKKIIFCVLAILLGVIIGLMPVELFLRLNPKFKYNYSSCVFKRNDDFRVIRDSFGYLRPHPLFGYELIPNLNSGQMPAPSNSFGLMGKEYELEKEKNTFRILLLGDSLAWCDWPRQFLEENLNNNKSLAIKYKFEIWNTGVPSYDVRRYYLYLKTKGLSYNPDMVIVFVFMNDFHLNTNIYYRNKNGAMDYYFPCEEIFKRGYPISPLLMKHSYLYRFIILTLNSYLESKKQASGMSKEEEDGRYYLGQIKEICDTKKIPLFVVIFSYLKPLKTYTEEEMKEYTLIRKVIKDLGISHINLYELLSGRDLYDLRVRKEDQIHFSRDGNRVIADLIYDYMLVRYFAGEKAILSK